MNGLKVSTNAKRGSSHPFFKKYGCLCECMKELLIFIPSSFLMSPSGPNKSKIEGHYK